MAKRIPVGLTIDEDIARKLDALKFTRRESKATIVERGIEMQVAGLSPAEREAFEAASAARGAR